MKVKHIQFYKGNEAQILVVSPKASAKEIISHFDLPKPKALIVLNGGTAKIDALLENRIYDLLSNGLAKYACEREVSIVTGATDAGIFYFLGLGLAQWGRTAPCIGVTVSNLVTWDGRWHLPWGKYSRKNKVPLEPHHSHFILVKEDNWGGETKLMYDFIKAYSEGVLSVAIFIGGGNITKKEMQANVRQGRKMILFQGSGRTTDTVITTAVKNQKEVDAMVREIALRGDIIPFSIERKPSELIEVIKTQLI